MSKSSPPPAAVDVMRGYRWGVTVLTAGLVAAGFLTGLGVDIPVKLDLLCLAGLSAGVLRAVIHLVRRTCWGLDSYLFVAVTLGTVALANFTVPGSALLTAHQWTFVPAGWPIVVCLLDRPLRLTLAALSVNLAMTLAALGYAGRWDGASLTAFAILALETTSQQIAGATFAVPLRRAAAASARDAQARAKLLAADAVAARLQQDNQYRYAALADSAVPLLQRLADGSADPAEDHVRWQARVEAARMRRLFAEAEPTADALLHEVRATIAEVERAAVAVTLDCRTPCPSVPTPLRRALLEHPMATLACAASTARVVIITEGTEVSVSVVTDGPAPPPSTASAHCRIQVRITQTEEQTWTQAACTVPYPR